jgi:hypothetical protein
MVISTKKFTWDKEEKDFSQEASSLGFPPGRVYKILVLESAKTKKQLYFALQNTIHDNEGEVGGWKYWNRETGLTCTIWND